VLNKRRIEDERVSPGSLGTVRVVLEKDYERLDRDG
jgi:hypothetical protein